MSLKKQAVRRNVQNVLSSSSASQHEGPIAQAQLLDPTQPNPPKTEKSRPNPTQPMGQLNPWTTLL